MCVLNMDYSCFPLLMSIPTVAGVWMCSVITPPRPLLCLPPSLSMVCAWAEWGGNRPSSAFLTFPSFLCSWECCPVSCWQELPAPAREECPQGIGTLLVGLLRTRGSALCLSQSFEGVKGEGYLSVSAASCSSGRLKSWQPWSVLPLFCYCLFLPWQSSGSSWDFCSSCPGLGIRLVHVLVFNLH